MPQIFNRNYRVVISDPDTSGVINSFEVRPPYQITFSCERKIGSGGSLDISLLGLGQKRRNLLSKRIYENAEGLVIKNGKLDSQPIDGLKKVGTNRGGKNLLIDFYIGYGDDTNLGLIFSGEIMTAQNTLSSEGFETEIQAITNYSARRLAVTSRTMTSRRQVIESLMSDARLEVGQITLVNNDYIKPKVIMGDPRQALKKMANGTTEEFYEDNGKGYFVIKTEETETPNPIIVKASTGLLNTPSRQAEFITLRSVINPEFVINSQIKVTSEVDPTVNGQYKIFDLIYIGDYEGESWAVDIQAIAVGATRGV